MLNSPSPSGSGPAPPAGGGESAGGPPPLPPGIPPPGGMVPPGGMLPQGAVSIQVTPEEKAAIDRVRGLASSVHTSFVDTYCMELFFYSYMCFSEYL